MLEQMLDELDRLRGVQYRLYSYRSKWDPVITYHAVIERELDGDHVEINRESRSSCADAMDRAWMAFKPLLEAYPKHERYDNLLEAPLSRDEELRAQIEEPF